MDIFCPKVYPASKTGSFYGPINNKKSSKAYSKEAG